MEKKEIIYHKIKSNIWYEESEPTNPYRAQEVYCHGYNVFTELIHELTWIQMLFLLFKGELPNETQLKLLEQLSVAIANPGVRDCSVHAAMCGGVGGSTPAASLMASLAVSAGQFNGAKEVSLIIQGWSKGFLELVAWKNYLKSLTEKKDEGDIWLKLDHIVGFDSYIQTMGKPTLRLLESSYYISKNCKSISDLKCSAIKFLKENASELEKEIKNGIAMTSVIAAILFDIGFNAKESEFIYLILRLPGAAVHAIEQENFGYKNFPFGNIEYK